MGIVSSLIIFAAGAILKFAVVVNSTHFNLNTIGIILMIVGAVGFVLSLLFWATWGGVGGYRRERTVVTDGVTYRDRTVDRSVM